MCGRFVMKSSQAELADFFGLAGRVDVPARFNIAPTDAVLGIVKTGGDREWRMFRWGLIPFWADDPSIGNRMINARSETVFDKPAFRAAIRRRRCLLPADGFYEWAGKKGDKQPYFISMKDGEPFAMAGIWEQWESGDGDLILSCAILTTSSNELISPLHPRMPVILDPEHWEPWLDAGSAGKEKLEGLLKPYPADRMRLQPVSSEVDNPRNEGEQLIMPLEEEA